MKFIDVLMKFMYVFLKLLISYCLALNELEIALTPRKQGRVKNEPQLDKWIDKTRYAYMQLTVTYDLQLDKLRYVNRLESIMTFDWPYKVVNYGSVST